MIATYRLIHFTPDPFTGARFPLGAVVVDGAGAVRVAKVEHLPLACLGDRSLAVAVRRLHGRLDSISAANQLPSVFGPTTTLAEPAPVPSGVADPHAWVEAMLNPPRPASRKEPVPQGAHRASLGFRFFETWQVARYVRKTFRPDSDGGRWLDRHAAGLPVLSHWVEGRDEVLLMEPVVPTRPQFEQDVQDLAVKLCAYRYALEQAEDGHRGALVVYLTAGGHPDQRAEAQATLAPFAHTVVDTDDAAQRTSFVERIRRVGAAGDLQPALIPEA